MLLKILETDRVLECFLEQLDFLKAFVYSKSEININYQVLRQYTKLWLKFSTTI